MRRRLSILLVALVAAMIAYTIATSGPKIPDGAVLVLELGGEIPETPPLDALAQFTATGPALPTLLLQIEKAAADPRIEGVLLHLRSLSIGWARLQELRDAVAKLSETGKPVVALLDMETLNATREVYLASAATQIYVVPALLGPFAGIAGQFMHFGGFLEKLGVRVEYERVGIYKSAPEMFAAREMSPTARAKANELLDGLYAQLIDGIATGRGMSVERVRELVESAPSTASDYVKAGLADGTAARSEVLEAAGLNDLEPVEFADYLNVDPQELGLRLGPEIALIFADGSISSGRGSRGLQGGTFAADRIAEALERAADDEAVRAIVLRINSPGGSALASDQIWQAVRDVRDAKPVVISMADAAASGGYFVASAADFIVAEPATLTGSIGVFFLRTSLGGLYAKLDIGSEIIGRGRFATLAVGDGPFTPEQREHAQRFVRAIYGEFVNRVATGREMSVEEVDRLGQGQVWLGEHALGLGLVDALGGLAEAVSQAKELAGIAPEIDPRRVVFPGPRNLREQIQDLTRGQLRLWAVRNLLPGSWEAPLRAVFELEPGVAYLPPYWIEFH